MKGFYNSRDSYIVYKNMSDNPINITQYVQIINQFMKFLIIHGKILAILK